MPSPEHEAELQRVLARAARECESSAAWFGEGLPQALKRALAAAGKEPPSAPAKLAFVELGRAAEPPVGAERVVALSTATLDALDAVVEAARRATPKVARLISPVAVLDFIEEGLRIRELGPALTAAEVQKSLSTPLHAGPDLQPMRGQDPPPKTT